MRELSKFFLENLKSSSGILYPILHRVKQDNTLTLAIRDNYINIYYRGGSILKLIEQIHNSYQPSFDNRYDISSKGIPEMPGFIKSQNDAKAWVSPQAGYSPPTSICIDALFSLYIVAL